MAWLQFELWPLGVAAAHLIVAAAINCRTLMTPNWLSLASILSGWGVAVAATVGVIGGDGGIGTSFLCTLLAGGVLLPVYAIGGLGAGCVKMQAAFGAWVGAALGLQSALVVTVAGSFAGALLAVVHAGLTVIQDRIAGDERAPVRLIPAQFSLSLGTVVGAVAVLVLGYA